MSAETRTDRERFYRNRSQLLHTAFEKVLRWRNEDCPEGDGNIGEQEVRKIYLFATAENPVSLINPMTFNEFLQARSRCV